MDAVLARVIQGRLNQAAKEMSRTLIRMGFSIVIKESEDIGCAITDPDGWQLCEADTTPLQVGPTPWIIQGVKRLLEERGENVHPGDVFAHNDPYYGASHSPDVAFVVPIFHEGDLIGWSCAAAHHLELGCSRPGTSIVDAVDEWAGGLRFRAMKIIDRGEENARLWQFIEDNLRIPRLVIGDMRAQIAACRLGAKRLLEIVDQVGRDEVFAAKEWWEAYAERRLRAEIEAIPDGDYHAEGTVDGFPEDPDPANSNLRLSVTLRVRGDELEIDLTGTAPQLDHLPINMPLQGTVMCSLFTGVRSVLLDSAIHEAIPQNRGLVRPIKIVAPEGSLVNPTFPAPTIARAIPAVLLTDTIVKAFAEIIPEKCCAGCGAVAVYSYSGIQNSAYWAHFDICEGSYGARWRKDGMDAVDTLMTNTRCAPIEEIETESPIRCHRWELNDNPVGHGRFRGGKSGVKEWEFLTDGTFANECDGRDQRPWGFAGGQPGFGIQMGIANTEDARLSLKEPGRPARRGQIFRLVGGNGGGMGSPLERDPERVLDDYLDEIVTLEESRDVYGVVIDPGKHAVLDDETRRLRERLRQEARA